MSRDSVTPIAEVEVLAVQRRRRYSAEEKQRLVEQTLQPGMNVSLMARQYRVAPSLLFRWRKLANEGALQAVGADESVVPASEMRAVQQQVKELQRLLGKKTLEHEILKEAVEFAREKKCTRADGESSITSFQYLSFRKCRVHGQFPHALAACGKNGVAERRQGRGKRWLAQPGR
jgi:transposase